MRKMAADFLDSNLLNPTAPSEQSLKEARRGRVHLGERNKWRLSKNEAETRMQPRKAFSYSLRNGFQSANNTDYAGDQPPKRIPDIPESSDEAFLKEGVPIEVLLHSTNLRQMQKDLMKCDMNIDAYCKDVLREKMRIKIENLFNPSVPLSVIEEDKEVQADVKITEEIKINETMTSEESSEGTSLYQDSHARNLSYAQKNLLYKLHYLFNANSRRGTKKEDKILLVRESNSELDLHQQRDSPASNGKRKNELKYFLVKRIQNLWHKWLQEKNNKEAILVEVSAPENKKKQKRRRLRKKNVSRIGCHIQKRFCHGCRYIGHGIANMTSIIPEASYAGSLDYFKSYTDYEYSCYNYEFSEYYDPNSPDWDYTKGFYMRRS